MWTKGMASAPKTEQILVRVPNWYCPAVIEWATYETEEYWAYSQPELAEYYGAFYPEYFDIAECAEISK